ncbi:MAG: apolipoprotein N-acyltransferase [Rikenellaceae bacterium]|nr:apolipoprotein N-acyltransferase [Rikenellaceae bacterium]
MQNLIRNKIFLVALAVVLLSLGWLRVTGLTLLVALVPLLVLSAGYDESRRSFWRVAGWMWITMLAWATVTCWWIWNSTPAGAIAALLVTATLPTVALMAYHYVSKRAPKALAYCTLVGAWIALEYFYLTTEASFPWLTLGNGFANEVWAVQWYEWTGVYGGSLWVLICNLLFFEALRSRSVRRAVAGVVAAVVPIVVSAVIWFSYDESAEKVKISVVQPNFSCFPIDQKYDLPDSVQDSIFRALIAQCPADSRYVLLPETALGANSAIWENDWAAAAIDNIRSAQEEYLPDGTVITGASTLRLYTFGEPASATARVRGTMRYDVYNSALEFAPQGEFDVRHKIKLVVGAEKVPYPRLMTLISGLIVELGGSSGQLGTDPAPKNFGSEQLPIGVAICYESVYGEFYTDFVRRGAKVMSVITNDGWWGETNGHRQHFSYSRLRAVETRRSVARSANTGISGFIDPRGRVISTLGWDERGVLTAEVPVEERTTLYVRLGDYVARLSCYLLLLCVLYYVAYRVRRRNHLVN